MNVDNWLTVALDKISQENPRETIKKLEKYGLVLDMDQILFESSCIPLESTAEDKERFGKLWDNCQELFKNSKYEILLEKASLPNVEFLGKHPYIFNIEDLFKDESEFERMKNSLDERKVDEKLLGWPSPPLLVATANVVEADASKIDEFVKRIKDLAKQYGVELYFGPRSFLKSILYPFLYSGKLDCKVVEDDPFDKLEAALSKGRNIGVIGALGLQITGKTLYKDVWGIEEISISTPASQDRQDWKQSKLRCGKGHNKHKRKGKK